MQYRLLDGPRNLQKPKSYIILERRSNTCFQSKFNFKVVISADPLTQTLALTYRRASKARPVDKIKDKGKEWPIPPHSKRERVGEPQEITNVQLSAGLNQYLDARDSCTWLSLMKLTLEMFVGRLIDKTTLVLHQISLPPGKIVQTHWSYFAWKE